MTSLSGKVALVTGASRGIGAAIARRLAEAGADIALTYNASGDKAEAVAQEIRALGRRAIAIRADSGDSSQVAAAVDKTASELGRLDILVNNAGSFIYGSIDQLTLDDFDQTFSVNVRAVFVGISQALKYLPDGGRIISIGTAFVPRVAVPGVSLYTASKTALVGLTKGIARDLGARRITVNLVNPGPTNTDMNPADGPNAPSALAFMALPTFGQPDDVAATILHLAGESGRQITGAVIDVDGGWNA